MSSVEKPQFRRWLFVWLCIALLFLLAGTWWTVGCYYCGKPLVAGFSEQAVTGKFEGTELRLIIKEWFPHCTLVAGKSESHLPVTANFQDTSDYEAMRFFSTVMDRRIIREGHVISITTIPWLENHSNGIQAWCRNHLHISLWPEDANWHDYN